MKKSKYMKIKKNSNDRFVSMCTRCFEPAEKCRCTKEQWLEFPRLLRGTYVSIDKDIYPIIRWLNQNGYYTEYCCQGHPYDNYISFQDKIKDMNIPVPEGFKIGGAGKALYCPRDMKSEDALKAEFDMISRMTTNEKGLDERRLRLEENRRRREEMIKEQTERILRK